MRGLNSETFDLIYLDPPFNSKSDYAAPIGSQAEGAAFEDTWTLDDVKQEWAEEIEVANPALWHAVVGAGYTADDSMQAYLTFMAVRLLEMRRLLKDTGSIYLHCDPTASHYLKQLMDAVFGGKQFRNEIVWLRAAGRNKGSRFAPRKFGADCDVILRYTKTNDFYFDLPRVPLSRKEADKKFHLIDEDGRRYETAPMFLSRSMTENSGSTGLLHYSYSPIKMPHLTFTSPPGVAWRMMKEKLQALDEEERVLWREGKTPREILYEKFHKGMPVGSLWDDISPAGAKESTGYPTQKPLALMERIIKASSDEGDMVLDPFCGCATTCVAAEKLSRQWVGIDIEETAQQLVVERLTDAAEAEPLLKTWWESDEPPIAHRQDIPKRTDSDAPTRSPGIKKTLFREQDGRCAGLCHDDEIGREFPIDIFEIDHIKPRSKGGRDIDENLQLLCPTCNGRKGNRTMTKLLERNFQDHASEKAEKIAAKKRASQAFLPECP